MLRAMGRDLGMCRRAKHADVGLCGDCVGTVLTLECAVCGGAPWLPSRRQPGSELICRLDGIEVTQCISN